MRLLTIIAAVFAAIALAASPAVANPGPGNSNQCAPGQHAGPNPPASCDNK